MAGTAKFQTERGKTLARRLKVAQRVHQDEQRDAKKLRSYYIAASENRRRWGVAFPIARTLIDGVICDSYVRNPDPYIEFLGPVDDPEISSKLRGLMKTLHEETDTERIIQRGMAVSSFARYAIHWLDFAQEHDEIEVPVANLRAVRTDDDGNPIEEPDAPLTEKAKVATSQRFRGELVMPSDFRRDPDGRSWEFTDHKWIARMYTRSLQDILDDESGAYTKEGKRLLKQWIGKNYKPVREGDRRSTRDYDCEEKDRAFQMVNVWEIWTRGSDYLITHVPVGAEFHIGEYDWPKTWKDADTFPATMIALESDWQPPDEDGEGGFAPLAALSLIQSPLENLPRLEAAFLDALTNTAKKYVGIDGLLDTKALAALQSDENRAYLPIDLRAISKVIAGGGQIDLTQFDLRRLMMLLPQEGGMEAAQHLQGIQHQLELCYLLLGVGPGDRAGVPEAGSATESMGIQERLSVRREKRIEEAARIADRITEKIWIVLRGQATLPIRYRYAGGVDSATWGVIADPTRELLGMEVQFKHHIGSSRPLTREAQKAERKELFSLIAPVLQATGDFEAMKEWIWWVANAYDNDFASRNLDTGQTKLAQQIVLTLDKVRNGQIPNDHHTGNQLLSMVAQFFAKYLSPPQMQQVSEQSVADLQRPDVTMTAKPGMGSLAKPKSAGASAYAAGKAGAVGGMG